MADSLCLRCKNLFKAVVLVDNQEYGCSGCTKNSSLFKEILNIDIKLKKDCLIREDGFDYPIVLKCNKFIRNDRTFYLHEEGDMVYRAS